MTAKFPNSYERYLIFMTKPETNLDTPATLTHPAVSTEQPHATEETSLGPPRAVVFKRPTARMPPWPAQPVPTPRRGSPTVHSHVEGIRDAL